MTSNSYRRLTWIGAGLILVLACLWVVASPARAVSGEVDVITADGQDFVTVSLSSIGSPVANGGSYGLDPSIEGYTVRQILQKAGELGFDSSDAEGFVIARAKKNKRPMELSRAVATTDSGTPPFFYESDGTTHFVMKGTGGSIFDDEFAVTRPTISLAKDTGIAVDLSADDTHIDVGDSINFEATPENLNAGEKVSYRWDFGDGTMKTTASKTQSHTFKKEGEFLVLITIVGQPSSRAASNGKRIIVGPAPKPKKDKKNKDKEDLPADTSTPDYGYSYPGGTGTGTGGYPGGSSGSPGAASPNPTPEPEKQPEPPVDDGLVEVSGELVSSSSPAPTMTPGEAAAQPPPVAVTPAAEGFKISSEAWTVLGLLALLGFGLLAERRGSKLY